MHEKRSGKVPKRCDAAVFLGLLPDAGVTGLHGQHRPVNIPRHVAPTTRTTCTADCTGKTQATACAVWRVLWDARRSPACNTDCLPTRRPPNFMCSQARTSRLHARACTACACPVTRVLAPTPTSRHSRKHKHKHPACSPVCTPRPEHNHGPNTNTTKLRTNANPGA